MSISRDRGRLGKTLRRLSSQDSGTRSISHRQHIAGDRATRSGVDVRRVVVSDSELAIVASPATSVGKRRSGRGELSSTRRRANQHSNARH